MAKKKKEQSVVLEEESTTVQIGMVSTIEIVNLTLKEGVWRFKMRVGMTLPKAFHRYRFELALDEKPYLDRIEELNGKHESGLFSNDPAELRALDEKIKEINKKLEERRGVCFPFEFYATVEELKYTGTDTVLVVRIPDDVIENINEQKFNLRDNYRITLVPVTEPTA